MSVARANAKRRTLMILGAAAAGSIMLGALAWMPPAASLMRSEIGRLVLPAFASKADLVALVMVTTSEESYHLVRNDDGWVMAEKGSYPVTDAKIQELTQALSNITYAQAMTRDERKVDRIGLGDPAQGGAGALLEVGDGKGNTFARLVVGYRDGRSFVRLPDDLQAWAVDGTVMPPLQRAAAWLDLDVVRVAPEDIIGAEIRPAQGPRYALQRTPDSGFSLSPPHEHRNVVSPLAPAMAAQALTRFAPTDVAPAADIASGAPLAEHVTRLASGVMIVTRCWRDDERGWVTVSAATGEGASPEAVATAAAINARAAPWAFALSELDWSLFATPLSAIAD